MAQQPSFAETNFMRHQEAMQTLRVSKDSLRRMMPYILHLRLGSTTSILSRPYIGGLVTARTVGLLNEPRQRNYADASSYTEWAALYARSDDAQSKIQLATSVFDLMVARSSSYDDELQTQVIGSIEVEQLIGFTEETQRNWITKDLPTVGTGVAGDEYYTVEAFRGFCQWHMPHGSSYR